MDQEKYTLLSLIGDLASIAINQQRTIIHLAANKDTNSVIDDIESTEKALGDFMTKINEFVEKLTK